MFRREHSGPEHRQSHWLDRLRTMTERISFSESNLRMDMVGVWTVES